MNPDYIVNFNYTENQISYLRRLVRVPEPLLVRAVKLKPINFAECLMTATFKDTQSNKENDFVVGTKKQLSYVQRLSENILEPTLNVFSSHLIDSHCQLLALHMITVAFERLIKTKKSSPNIRWVKLFGGKVDPREDLPDDLDFLVISNVYHNDTFEKTAKLRDLCAYYDSIPVIIVAGGANPIEFSYKHINKPIKNIAYLPKAYIGI